DQIGPATDVYALGTIFYELLTGQRPFQGSGVMQILIQLQERKPAPPRQLQPAIPPDLERICLRCLEKRPSQRYATAGDLGDDLEWFLSGAPIRALSAQTSDQAQPIADAPHGDQPPQAPMTSARPGVVLARLRRLFSFKRSPGAPDRPDR